MCRVWMELAGPAHRRSWARYSDTASAWRERSAHSPGDDVDVDWRPGSDSQAVAKIWRRLNGESRLDESYDQSRSSGEIHTGPVAVALRPVGNVDESTTRS